MTAFHILGDGLAALMLASRLAQGGARPRVYGDGQTNTPPVGLVHLFAGRTFRRSALELEAFSRAARFWGEHRLAREYPVRRLVEPGDRLERSLANLSLPAAYLPRRREDGAWGYGPGFAVFSQQLETERRQELGEDYHAGRFQADALPAPRILAVGTGAPEALPGISWDLSQGRTVKSDSPQPPELIHIGKGIHAVPAGGNQVVIGGRFSPIAVRHDELELAQALTGLPLSGETVWSGSRCAAAQDRRPVLGWLDDGESFIFTGFGSRALFWLPFCLDLAVAALCHGSPVPDELHWRRLSESPRGDGGLTL